MNPISGGMIAPPKIKALINPEAELSSALSRPLTASAKILGNIIELNNPIEMIVRDLRVHQILEGTNEIMRVIISRDLMKD